MSNQKSAKRLTTLIILFPLMVLLVYGGSSYLFFIFTQDKENQHRLKAYEETLIEIEKERLREKVNNLAQFITYYDSRSSEKIKSDVQEDILHYIKANGEFKHGHFLLFNLQKNILYHPNNGERHDVEPYMKKGFYKDNSYLTYTGYIKEFDWYIAASSNMKVIQTRINENKKMIEFKQKQDSKSNLYLLSFSWIISLFLSVYLSVIINKLLKNYEQQIRQSNEKLVFQSRQALIGELFSMIAHQWRQPINKIASILALLRFNVAQKNVDLNYIDKECEHIENSIEFMSETIDDFKNFYHPKTAKQSVLLHELIDKAMQFVDMTIEKKSITVIKNLEEIQYELYQNEFVQVMLNLIKNAIDAIQHDGELYIHLYSEKDGIHIDVKNTQEKFDITILEKLFEPYFTTKNESLGLGLYMVKIIIEQHMKGTISVEYTKPYITFTIILPH